MFVSGVCRFLEWKDEAWWINVRGQRIYYALKTPTVARKSLGKKQLMSGVIVCCLIIYAFRPHCYYYIH